MLEYPNDGVSLGIYKAGVWTEILFLVYSVATIMIFALAQSLKESSPLLSRIAYFTIFAGVTIFIAGLNIVENMTLSVKNHQADSPEAR